MPILHSSGEMTPGQFGPIRRIGFGFRSSDDCFHSAPQSASESVVHAHHIEHRHAFGNGDDNFAAGIRRLQNRIARKRGRHENHRGVGTFLLHGLVHGVEHRHAQRGLPAFPGRHAGNQLRAVLHAIL